MGSYLIALDLQDKLCLVVGGGQVAQRKVSSLLAGGALVRIVAPMLTPSLHDMVEQGRVFYRQRQYCAADLEGVFLVICATDDQMLNRQIAAECAARNLLVNVVDEPEECNFFVPAVVRRGDLSIAVSTAGKSPLLARKLREELEEMYGPQYGEFLALIASLRQKIIHQVSDKDKKRELLENIISDEIWDLLKSGHLEEIKERLYGAYRDGWT